MSHSEPFATLRVNSAKEPLGQARHPERSEGSGGHLTSGSGTQPTTVARRGKVVVVDDLMQRGYRYRLTEPAGRNFDPRFRPELTPRQMLRLGVFGGKYMTDCARRVPGELVRGRQVVARVSRSRAELLRGQRVAAALGVAEQGLAQAGGPARLVPVVLPLLSRPPDRG